MNKEDLFENMSEIDDTYIDRADTYKTKKKMAVWVKCAATAACLCLVIGAMTLFPGKNMDSGAGKPVAGGNAQDFGEEKEDITEITEIQMAADTDLDVDEDQPVQNETVIQTSFDDIWGGSYLDESGKWIIWLTENTTENQQKVFKRNRELTEKNVTFKDADFSLVYLNELLAVISDEMSGGKLPFVSTAMVSEQTNRVEVYLSSNDEKSVKIISSFDDRGAIVIRYSDDEGGEDLGALNE